MCITIGKSKVTISEFSQGTAKLTYKMTQYDNLNAKLWKLQLDKLKLATKDATGVTLRQS